MADKILCAVSAFMAGCINIPVMIYNIIHGYPWWIISGIGMIICWLIAIRIYID